MAIPGYNFDKVDDPALDQNPLFDFYLEVFRGDFKVARYWYYHSVLI